MAELEDEDEFPNDFDGLDFEGIPMLQAPSINRQVTPEVSSTPTAITRNVIPPATASSPVWSTGSNGIESMDFSFLAAVDELEARALSKMAQASGSLSHSEPVGRQSNAQGIDSFQGESSSVTRKGKRKAELQQDIDVQAILAGYESELSCPICCDLLVGAQVANPCGHTCCGECSYGWLAQNKYEPTCAMCRSSLSTKKPFLPNFSADNLVRQHLQALRKSGRPDWQEKGYRTIEWNKRLESWKKMAAIRAAQEKTATSHARRHQQRYYGVEGNWVVFGISDDDSEASIPHVMPRRGTRSRRF